MIWWVFLLVSVTILSYLSDVGILTFLQDFRLPFLNASLMSIMVLLCLIGLLARMMKMSKKGKRKLSGRKSNSWKKNFPTLKASRNWRILDYSGYSIEVINHSKRIITPTRIQLPPKPKTSSLVGFMISQFEPGLILSFSNFSGFS